MADYVDNTGWGDEARLYFSSRGSVESFPLPDGYRRFVLRTSCFIKDNPADFLAQELPLRCGVSLDTAKPRFESAFGVQHFKASSFARPYLFLCGDAAHVMSPIGGQNMNTGFADAELAAFLVAGLHKGTVLPEIAAKVYDRYRKTAANTATQRAALMMRAGTSGGVLWNGLRNGVMSIALRTPITSLLYGMFTMLSIPNRDLPSVLPNLKRDLKW
jgi:2-polyprenyl-6-methoxyphenol hydroxylase-like FAD-dependent oxidoreductase